MSSQHDAVLGLWLDPGAGPTARRAFLRTLVAAKAAGRTAWLLDLCDRTHARAEGLGDEEQRWLEALDAPAPTLEHALQAAGSLLVLAPAARSATPSVLVVDASWLEHTPPAERVAALREAGQVVRAS